MRSRIPIDEGHDFTRGVEPAKDLKLARYFAAARRKPVGQSQHSDIAAPELPGDRVDQRPSRIADAVHDDVQLVIRIVLPQEPFHRGGEEWIEPANTKDDGGRRAFVIGQHRPAEPVEEANITNEQGRLPEYQAGHHPRHDLSNVCHNSLSFFLVRPPGSAARRTPRRAKRGSCASRLPANLPPAPRSCEARHIEDKC